MRHSATLKDICLGQTFLHGEDIVRLEGVAAVLPLIADLVQADVFIDCMDREGVAVVAAQESPHTTEALYRKSVVGERAYSQWEPAVYLAFSTGQCRYDLRATTQEGRAVKQSVVPIRGLEGKVAAVLIAERDVSDDIRHERKYREMARAVESMSSSSLALLPAEEDLAAMREIHHRVKNNLQLVASILNMQARKAPDAATKKIFQENVNRVLSIAAIHDILTLTEESGSGISSAVLLEKLRRNLQGLVPEGKVISLQVEGDDLQLSPDCATSVSLVVSELITNALEHAFPGRDRGRVVVRVCRGRLCSTVSVEDDGVGFRPEDVRRGSLGMGIVRATVEGKLHGQLRVDTGPRGTAAFFDIPNDI